MEEGPFSKSKKIYSWSRLHAHCKICGKNVFKHRSQGLCSKCYSIQNSILNRGKQRTRVGEASAMLTKEYLFNEYVQKKRSLGDIAKQCKCSRPYVLSRLKLFAIQTRSLKEARDIALGEGKIHMEISHPDSSPTRITLNKVEVDETFFSVWSDKMAYSLGVVVTDGHISPGSKIDRESSNTTRTPRLVITQKEPELLEKVRKAMNCNAGLHFRKERVYNGIKQGGVFKFEISRERIYYDLVALGLNQDKSLTMKFPVVPKEYLKHFIRGCWDGDGSVYIGKNGRINATYVCGSKAFIVELAEKLKENGILNDKIYLEPRKNISYKIRYWGDDCKRLHHYLYDGVNSDLYLKRKKQVFEEYYNKNK